MLDTSRYVIALLCVLTVPYAFLYWFVVHPFIGFWRARGPRVTFSILVALSIAMIAMTWPWRGWLLSVEYGTGPILWVLAALCYSASVVVEVLCRTHLKFRTLVGVPELANQPESDGLLQEGIYARIRHPRYVSVTTGLLAAALFCNYLATWLILVGAIPAVLLIVYFEERELRERFGEAYVEYSRRVPRFVSRWN